MPGFSPERWQRLIPHLDRALQLDADERSAWLASLRADDPELADDVATLLEKREALSRQGFLEEGAPPLPAPTSIAGQAVGAYVLVSPIGRGGMGSVWLARRSDGRFEGFAAIKLLNASLIGQTGEERFRREGNILARLRHPHIATLIDAGVSAADQPYLVLEHIAGEHIDRYCDARHLDVEARVRLFLDVLAAVAFAHANLVVHRDIKPSNVLVGSSGQVKLLDFGIAKLLIGDGGSEALTAFTREGGGVLTLQYAAPEQLTHGPITTATDVYSLGVLLYMLLTGRHPAAGAASSPAALVRAIVDTEPARLSEAVTVEGSSLATPQAIAAERATTPRKLRSALRGDLDNIVSKALKKRPAERYASAEALADDLRRYLDRRPVRARADSLAYRGRKFVARNRLTVAAAMLAMLALVTGGAIAVWQARKAAGERDRALVQLDRAEATNDLSGFLLSEATPTAGRPITNAELLARGEMLVDRRFKDDPALRAHMLLILSERYHENDQFDRWQATVDRAFSLSRSIADAGLRARAACVKAGALDDQGRVDEADRLLSSALQELAVSTDTAADEAYCRICEANMANRRGDAPRAVVAAERAVALEEGRSGPAGRGFEALFLLATAYFVADRCAAADEVFRRLLAMLERHGRDDTRDAALVLNNWSTMLQQAGQPLRALPLSERAVRIARERDSDRGALPVILRSHATALCSVGRCEEAVPFADEAIAKAAASGSIRRRYGALSTAATVHGQAGHLARASELLAEVERVLEAGRAELPAQQAVLERRQAQLALLRGDAGTAATLAARAAAREDDLRQDTTAAIQVMLVLAQAQNTHGNVEAGRAAAERALTIGRVPDGMEHSAWTGQAHLELGVALAGQGHIEESLAELRQALEHLETCAGREAAPTRRALAQLDRLGR